MLVLTRKVNEKILIGDNIEIVVLQVRGDRVRIGFSAPDDVQIHREEVRQRIKQERSRRHSRRSKRVEALPVELCSELIATDTRHSQLAPTHPVAPEVLR